MAGIPGQQATKPTTIPAKYSEDFLDGIDQRFKPVRQLKARMAMLTSDLGGEESLSYARRSLCRRALFLEVQVESVERRLAAGETVDTGAWIQAVNSLLGLFRTLGLERKARTIPELSDYLASHGND